MDPALQLLNDSSELPLQEKALKIWLAGMSKPAAKQLIAQDFHGSVLLPCQKKKNGSVSLVKCFLIGVRRHLPVMHSLFS